MKLGLLASRRARAVMLLVALDHTAGALVRLAHATYCNDGATEEPWGIGDLYEANAEDPMVHDLVAAVAALDVGQHTVVGGGAVATTKITRLS